MAAKTSPPADAPDQPDVAALIRGEPLTDEERVLLKSLERPPPPGPYFTQEQVTALLQARRRLGERVRSGLHAPPRT